MSEPEPVPDSPAPTPARRGWTLSLTWLASVVAAFLLGALLAPSEFAHPADAATASRQDAAAAPGASTPAADPVPLPTDLARLRSHAASPHSAESHAELVRRIGALPLTEVIALADEVLASPPGPDSARLLGLLFSRWGELDGTGALLVAQEASRRFRNLAITHALTGWAITDPAAAVAWLRAAPNIDNNLRPILVQDLAEALVAAHGWRALDQVPSEDVALLNHTRSWLLRALLEQGRLREAQVAASGWFDPADRASASHVRHLAQLWAQWDPPAAALWLADWHQRAGTPPQGLDNVLYEWAADDPLSALDWIDRNAALAEDLRSELRTSTFRAWIWSGSTDNAATWLNGRPAAAADDPLRELLADHFQVNDPAAAMAWAGSIVDSGKRAAVAGWILTTWRDRAPAEATAWVASHGHELVGGVTPPLRIELDGQILLIQPNPIPNP